MAKEKSFSGSECTVLLHLRNMCGGDVNEGVILRAFLLDGKSLLDIHTTIEGGGSCDGATSPTDIAVFGFED